MEQSDVIRLCGPLPKWKVDALLAVHGEDWELEHAVACAEQRSQYCGVSCPAVTINAAQYLRILLMGRKTA